MQHCSSSNSKTAPPLRPPPQAYVQPEPWQLLEGMCPPYVIAVNDLSNVLSSLTQVGRTVGRSAPVASVDPIVVVAAAALLPTDDVGPPFWKNGWRSACCISPI